MSHVSLNIFYPILQICIQFFLKPSVLCAIIKSVFWEIFRVLNANIKKVQFSFDVNKCLERKYNKNPSITTQERRKLAEELGLTEQQLIVWFKNRKQRGKHFQLRLYIDD